MKMCVCVCLRAEAGAFLVRHRRSRILSEPRPRPQDEALGEVNPSLWSVLRIYWCFCQLRRLKRAFSASPSFQWRHFHVDSRAHPPPWRLHRRLHRGGAARREPHPLGAVPLAPGEPGTGVRHTQPGTHTHTHTHTYRHSHTDVLICQLFFCPSIRWRSATAQWKTAGTQSTWKEPFR